MNDILKECKKYSLFLLSKKPYTIFEIKSKLEKKNYPESVISDTISYLVSINYLNDRSYTENYIEECLRLKNASLFQIKNKLLRKGISETLIENIIETKFKNVELEKSIIAKDIEKYIKKNSYKNLTFEQLKAKLYNYLISKGYAIDVVKSMIESFKE